LAIDERFVFHEGKYVRLKVLEERDVIESGWVGWFNDELISEYNQHHYFPNTLEAQMEALRSCSGPDKLQLGIVDRESPEQICGVVSLSGINFIHRYAEIAGIHSTNQTRHNSAIFFESWAFMLRHGFEQLGLQKIHGGSFHPHVTSALKRMFNFEVEGVRRRHVFKRNTYHDVTLIAVFADTVRYPDF